MQMQNMHPESRRLQNPNPGQDPAQPPDSVPGPGQVPNPVRDPVPGQPVDPTIPPLRDPNSTPDEPDRAP
jgi:hypothetical protein